MRRYGFLFALCAIFGLSASAQDGLHEIIAAGGKLEKVACCFKFTEGPAWHPRGFLIFSDIPADTIYKWDPRTGRTEVFRRPSGHANGNLFDLQGRLVTCEHDRRVSRTERDGSIVTLAARYQGKRLNSPNDLAIRSDGSIYFTDPPYGISKEQEELGFYGVYRLTPRGELSLLDRSFKRPNGIAFSPDERRLYVSDSAEGTISVFDVLPDGSIANKRVFATLEGSGEAGVPDGMKVDERGNIYCTGPHGVWIFAPDGRKLGIIETPEVPANLAWGDADRRTLYITARTSVYRLRMRAAGPNLGPAAHK